MRFGEVRVKTEAERHVFEVDFLLHSLDPKAVRIELYADGIDNGEPVREEMKRVGPLPDASPGCTYRATVPATRPARDYTPRAIPQRAGVAVPLECTRIVWQR